MTATDQLIATAAGMVREPHAITRARERYGIELTLADLDTISRDVATGRSIRLASQADGTTRHAVLVQGIAIIVAVSKDGRVVTVLPCEKPLSGARPFSARRP